MYLLLSLAAAAPTHAQIEAAAWSHISDRNHDDAGKVQVFSTNVGGIECFKATAITSEADGKTMLQVVSDIGGAKRWSTAGITKAEVLGRAGNTISYYQYLDVPGWTMASDRYWFLQAVITDVAGTWAMKWSKLDPNGPYSAQYSAFKASNSSAVEPRTNVGAWIFRNDDFGVSISYMICTEGGSIPAAIQSAVTRKTLPDTVGDVVREAKKRLGKN